MRASKGQARRSREHVVEVAARLFRERGFDGVGVADLMRCAGLTHGGFYRHFPSKEALMAEAAGAAFAQRVERFAKVPGVSALLASHVSGDDPDDPGAGCPLASLGGDAARRSEELKDVFARGLEAMLTVYEAALDEVGPLPSDRRRTLAVNLLAKTVGAIVLARSVPAGSALGCEILATGLAGALADAAGR